MPVSAIPPEQQPFLAVVERWRRAELAGATDELATLLADDFIGVGPMGWIRTKPQWLAKYGSGAVRNDVFELSDIRILDLGTATLVVAHQKQHGVNGAADTSGEFRFSLTVTNDLIRSIHVTRIIEPR
ncbi:nuclear transport factor 2 family protein [Nocardia higoensis]|uniref:Nuclear transport factor 2 family protein n=1 Tax=Nocardia higoensis TaxID=228599 RepID=A0ABS0D7M3_9NOCA|nr:nuclear transport factor 2 family protein [Nocardia higoensis]MBF6354477.1 nuclear transport factor 2 family protein [Nocardia higoensis]